MKIQISVIIFFLCFNILRSEKRANKQLIPYSDTQLVKRYGDGNVSKVDKKRQLNFPSSDQIDLLRSLLDASPERLRVMKKTIERVESMSPDQKRNVKMRLRKLRDAPPHIRFKELGNLRLRYEKLNKYWKSLKSEKRKSEMKNFQNLSLSERDSYFRDVVGNH
jgi:hypothetical protein